MRVAVIGADLTGVLVALNLAERGCDVTLFERSSELIGGASYGNEGKIHLGYVYAMDSSLRTAHTMLRGAEAFRCEVGRWTGMALFERHSSKPFIYAAPLDSMKDPASIQAYFDAVSDLGESYSVAPGGRRPLHTSRLSQSELSNLFDASKVSAAWQTEEGAIDPLAIRLALIEALSGLSRIEIRLGCEVQKVEDTKRGWAVAFSLNAADESELFDIVINSAWEQRLAIDATVGISQSRPVVHRYKCGLRTGNPGAIANLPSVTFLVGEYGDAVAYAEGAYINWYPAGMIAQVVNAAPACADIAQAKGSHGRLVQDSLSGILGLMPAFRGILEGCSSDWDVVGGWITAWGDSGIQDRRSHLHQRHEIGVHSHFGGRYLSVDSGKYTTAPLFAREAVSVLGL